MASAEPAPLILKVTRYQVEGDSPLGAMETDAILSPYLGEHSDLSGIDAAAETLERAIRARNNSFVRVVVPAQKPEGGEIRLQIVEYRLGNVEISGNQHYDTANIRRSLPDLQEGHIPKPDQLSGNLAVANEHPGKQVNLLLKDGEAPRTLDAEIKVQDTPPLTTYASLSNTGSRETGENRLTLGMQHQNLWNADHVLSASVTTSPGYWSEVRQLGLIYTLPLYSAGMTLSGFYTYSDVNSGTIADFFTVSGQGRFYGLKAYKPLARQGNWNHGLGLDLEYRQFDNNIAFLGTPLGGRVNSAPLSLRYQGRYLIPGLAANGGLQWISNTGWSEAGNQDDYSRTRAGASTQWSATRAQFNVLANLDSQWRLGARWQGQWTSKQLIPGEQFGIGGATSVRGFRERETSGDQGWAGNLELWLPSPGYNISPLVFVDAGETRFKGPGGSTENISSLGLGFRWQWQKQLDLSLDLAQITNGVAGGSSAGERRGHAALMYRF